jgi:hypothetical protein
MLSPRFPHIISFAPTRINRLSYAAHFAFVCCHFHKLELLLVAAFRADQILSDIVAITEFAYVDQLVDEYMATIFANHI